METKYFPCSQEGILGAQEFLETVMSSPKPAIILDEIVSNIVRCSGANGFSLAIDRTADGLKMVFTDDGKPFDPLTEVAAPDISAGVEDRGIGGLGIFMVKKMSKSVAYRRDGEKNVLTVVM